MSHPCGPHIGITVVGDNLPSVFWLNRLTAAQALGGFFHSQHIYKRANRFFCKLQLYIKVCKKKVEILKLFFLEISGEKFSFYRI